MFFQLIFLLILYKFLTLNNMKLENSIFFDNFLRNVKKQKSFTITGLTTFSRLLLTKYIKKISNKKILFITSTEQNGLKYKSDLETLFDLKSEFLPYQNVSVYETISGNLYDYQRQLETGRAIERIFGNNVAEAAI